MKKFIALFTILSTLYYPATAQDHGPDALYEKLVKEYTLNPDGSYDYHLYKEVRLNTHYSFHRQQGETFIVYNPEFQSIKINKAYTVMADGTTVEVPENAFNEVLPRFARNIPEYNHLREMVVTHTGLETGAVIHLDYSIHTQADFMPAFMGFEEVLQEAPVRDMQLIVNIPGDQSLEHKTFNIRTAPVISEKDGKKTVAWSFRNTGAASRESHIDPGNKPAVMFSSAGDLKRAYFRFVNQPAFTFQVGPQLASQARAIAKKKAEPLETMFALQEMVANDLRTWNVPEKYTGFACRTPEEVWKSNGGTPLEKAVLLTSLLIEAGINARTVALVPEKFYSQSAGTLLTFGDYLVQANPVRSGQWYVSPTHTGDQNLIYSLRNEKALLLDGAVESLRTFEGINKRSEVHFEAGFAVRDTGRITGTVELGLKYAANPYARIYRDKEHVKKLVQGISPGEIRTAETDKFAVERARIRLEIEKDDPFETNAHYLFLTMPESKQGTAEWHISYLSALREDPFVLENPIRETYEASVRLPGNIRLVTPLQSKEINKEIGSVLISLEQKKPGEITIRKELEINTPEIGVNQYGDFRAIMDEWISKQNWQLIFSLEE